jgi:hypothetical protein
MTTKVSAPRSSKVMHIGHERRAREALDERAAEVERALTTPDMAAFYPAGSSD